MIPAPGIPLPGGEAVTNDELLSMRNDRALVLPAWRKRRPRRWGGRGRADATAMAARAISMPIDMTGFPFRAIAYIRTFMRGVADPHRGSGFFVSRNLVATAAHNLEPGAGTVDFVEVHVDVNGALGTFAGAGARKYRAAECRVNPAFVLGAPETDYGVIRLVEPVGDAVGFFTLTSIADEDLDQLTINVGGYPLPGLTQVAAQTGLVATASSSELLAYDAGTAVGQSGAPVWRPDTDLSVAIHNFEVSARDVGARCTADLIDLMMNF